MSDPQRPYPHSPSPFPPPVSHRQARIHYSLSLLHSHPAVNSSGPHAAYRPPASTCIQSSPANSQQVPSTVIKALFNDLVRRELGVDPSNSSSTETASRIETQLSRNRAVAPKPSLSDPAFVAHLATGHCPTALTDPNLISAVAPPTVPKVYSPSAAQIHRAIQEAREQQLELHKAQKATKRNRTDLSPKRPRGELSLRRSTRKRTRRDAHLENSQSEASANPSSPRQTELGPADMTAMPRHSDTPRRTRSASCRLRRSSSNHTTSECCFCPDPELFDGEEIKSELIGPFVNRKGQAKLFVHFDCACWAPQVFADAQSGQLRGVYDEYCRGRKLKCSDCGGRGATIGCYVQRCKHVFHFRCLPRSGARRVERFFVAFCANHAHLGEKQSYKILMEAATIADVAEAHRRQDTTFGLDAPHSRYTQLRRRETELIFSRKFGICSHAGAFETNKVIFSHKRRKILGKTDRLLLTEQPRALLTSAFDVASGRLAYMSVAGNDKVDNMTAVEARAALASREKSTLFLLRNLRRAPTWSKHNMTVVKKSGSDAAPPAEPASAIQHEPRSPALSKLGRQGEESPAGEGDSIHECNDHVQLPCHLDEGDKTGTDPSGERRSKRRRISTGARLENDDQEVKADVSDGQLQSAPLPAFKKTLRTAEAESLLAPVEHTTPVSGGGEQVSADMELLKDSPTSKASPDRAAAKKSNGSPSRDKKRKLGVLPPNLVASSRQGLAGKVKSAWETFLEEQLPKERILRPDDSEVEAMRNMARLWSLLSVEARESYEERARQAGLSGCDAVNGMNTADKASLRPLKRPKLSNRLPKRLPDQAVGPRADDPGLFVSSDRAPSSSTNIEVCETAVKKGVGKRQLSVSLPRRSWTSRVSLPGMELLAVEWDDVLPTSLGPDAANTDTDTEKVRRPPPRNKKM